jgi:outer membrane protein assembly factor BamB
MAKHVFKRSVVAMAVVLGLGVLTACSSSNPRFDPVPLTDFQPEVQANVRWSTSVGSGGGYGFAPMVLGPNVYAATPSGAVAKVDVATGRPVWSTNVDKRLSAGVGADGRLVVVAASDCTVIALDDQGQEQWRAQAASEVNVPPAVGYGVVVVRSSDYRLQAFDAKNGELLWSVQRPGPALALKTSIQMDIVDGMLIAGMPNGRVMAVDLGTGAVQWEGTVAVSKGATDLERIIDVVGLPLIRGPLLCAAAYQGRIVCFDVSKGGVPVWSRDFSTSVGIGADDRFVYAANRHDVLSGFSMADGTAIWSQEGLRNRRLSAPAVVPEAVVVGDSEGYVHLLSRSDGRFLGRVSVGGGAITSPLVGTDRGVVVQTGNGKLLLVGVN